MQLKIRWTRQAAITPCNSTIYSCNANKCVKYRKGVNKSEELPEEDLRDVVSGDDLQPQPHVQQYPPHCHSVRIPTLIFIFVASDTRFGPLALIDCGQSQLFRRRHRRCVARRPLGRPIKMSMVRNARSASLMEWPRQQRAREISVWETRKQKRFMSFELFSHFPSTCQFVDALSVCAQVCTLWANMI